MSRWTCGVAVAVQATVGTSTNRFGQSAQHPIVGTKLVSPLRNAVRLVDRNQARLAPFQQVAEAVGVDPLGRDVEQLHRSIGHRPLDLGHLHRRERAVQILRVGASPLQRRHLVVHQSDQRRDHDRQPVRENRRQLVTQRLAAAGRHEHQRIPAIKDVFNRLPLLRPKRVVAVVLLERSQERIRQSRERVAHHGAAISGRGRDRRSVAPADGQDEVRPARRSGSPGYCSHTRPGSCPMAHRRRSGRPPRIPPG